LFPWGVSMQTKHQIQQLLVAAGAAPQKRLGQHFLIDLNLMRLMVDTAGIVSRDVVLEVGCGTGSLTEALAVHAGHVVAVDMDEAVWRIARSQLAGRTNVTLLNTDVLAQKHTLDPAVQQAIQGARRRCPGSLLLVANLPYHVASPLMLNLLEDAVAVDKMVVTVQKEVADRMIASPASPDYGSLSVLLQAVGHVELMRVLKPAVFWPPPQVDSAIVTFARRADRVAYIHDLSILHDVVALLMGHRRKTVRAASRTAQGRLCALSDWFACFQDSGVDPGMRPDRMTPEDYVHLANAVAHALRNSGY